jgi:hypothetical protein
MQPTLLLKYNLGSHISTNWWSQHNEITALNSNLSTAETIFYVAFSPHSVDKFVVQGLTAKFIDSPYCSELELCGGVVKVSSLKHLPWQAMHFLQHFTHFLKMCSRLFTTSFRRIVEHVVLTSWYGWKGPEIARGEIWTV